MYGTGKAASCGLFCCLLMTEEAKRAICEVDDCADDDQCNNPTLESVEHSDTAADEELDKPGHPVNDIREAEACGCSKSACSRIDYTVHVFLVILY